MPRRLRPLLIVVLVLAGALPVRGAGPAPVPQDPVGAPPAKAAALFRAAPAPDATARVRGEKAPPSLQALVLLCEFQDAVFYGREEDPSQVDPVFAEIVYAARDTLYYRHLMRDVRQYFDSASGGAFTFNATVHQQVVELPQTMGFYGNHPEHGEQPVVLARDVLAAVDPDVDFGGYDTILLVHAGAGEETDINDDSRDQIYSTYLDPESFQEAFDEGVLTDGPWLEVDGGAVRIDQVLVLPETGFQDGIQWGSLGLYCFEVGQRLGMLPLGTGNRSWGIGSLGLMGWGLYAANGWNPPHPCAYNKLLMGWLDPPSVVPTATPTDLALTPALYPGAGTPCVRAEIGPDEYWLLEYRLQDPDGNERWNIDPVLGDLNGNGFRDFVDADAADGRPERDADGNLLEKFHPEEGDEREWLFGAEWDFHMTFNGQRPRSEDTGRGSGVYVWHVDENVIQASLAAGTRLVNWDPQHKGVDLEEADGIQDMDSMRSDIEYAFGHENDVFEGPEAVFGPTTAPRTDTAAGVATGILFEDFATVRQQDGSYVPEMTVTVSRSAPSAGPALTAQRDLPPGTDLTGSHVLLADLDPTPGGTDEIVLTDRTGEVFVLDGALDDFVDDGDPDAVSPFAVGTYADTAVVWNPPAAAGDLDGDGVPEIVLTAANGLYAFTADGTPLRDVLPQAHGLHVELPACAVPPVLLLPDAADGPVPETLLRVAVVVRDGGTTRLRMYQGADADVVRDVDLGDVVVRAAPVLAFARLWIAAADTAGGDHRLLGVATAAAAAPEVLDLPLDFAPGPWPPAWGLETGAASDARGWVAVAGADGRGATLWIDRQGQTEGFLRPWSPRLVAGGPLAAGAVLADGVCGVVGPVGDWEDGWPWRPDPAFAAADPAAAAAPLTAELAGAVRAAQQRIFSLPDGRLLAFGPRGEVEEGWPLAGPGRSAGSPALGQVGGGTAADLVAIGTFGRMTGIDHDTGVLDTVARSVVAVWNDVAVPGGAWPMWGGGPARSGVYDVVGAAPPLAGAPGKGIIEGSHICYPSPLTGTTLYVRARLRGPGRVRAHIYDLEGERITVSSWRQVAAQSAFDLPVELGGVVSGMYLCRLEAVPDGGERVFSVIPFAVSR